MSEPNAADDYDLEHQFGAAAHRRRREVREGGSADVLCLQETKCPDDRFPLKRFKRLGYEHVALNGQKGYHGVVVLSRLPFETFNIQSFCGKTDCRHVSAVLGERAGLRDPITLHNLYVPAGGDVPDPAVNPKFAHKLAFLDEMRASAALRCQNSNRMILLGDLN